MRQAVRGLAAFMLYCDSEVNTRPRRIRIHDRELLHRLLLLLYYSSREVSCTSSLPRW